MISTNDKINNLIIVQTAFLGDVALALPLANFIKQIEPQINIHFVTTPQAAEIVRYAKSIDSVILFDKRNSHSGLKGIRIISEEISMLKPEFLIALHKSLRTTLLSHFSKAAYSIGYSNSSLSFFYKQKVPYYQHRHEIDRNFCFVPKFLNISQPKNIGLETDFKFPLEDHSFVEEMLKERLKFNKDGLVLIAPGSVWPTKRWQSEKFIQLSERFIELGYNVALMGAKSDATLYESVNVKNLINFIGVFSIPQSLILMQKARLVITNDSAPTHFAGLVGTPVLTIFGPTSPKFGFAPRNSNSDYIELSNLKCKPCSIHGGKKCPLKHHRCMSELSVDTVLKKAIELLNT